MRRAIPSMLGAASVLLATTGSALAQDDYPSRLIRVIVAWPPGTGVDVMMRLMAEPLRAELGQTLVIDNRGGASGVIGSEVAALAPPDGYTLLFNSAALTMVAAMGVQTTYKVPDSFTPVVNVANAPMLLVSHPSLNLKTPQDLVKLAKSKPGQLIYANSGHGSPSHFAAELFLTRNRIAATGVSYRGSPQTMLDLIAGRAMFLFTTTSTSLPQVRGGKVTALAITSRKRHALAPEIPTMDELGYKDFSAMSYWNGLLGPKGLPLPIANRVAAAVNRVLARPDVLASLAPAGNEIDGMSDPQSFAAMMKDDLATWVGVVKAANIKPE